MNSDFLAGLNPAQLAAVTTRSHALVLAGAGSGKTRVLTSRIAWLLREGLASPASVLAVTFTNKAAREMQTRVGAMLPVNPRMMWIGTFHGLAHRLLRLHHRDAGLPATFTILDSQDQLAAIKRLLKALNLSDDTYPPRQLMQFINRHKEQGLRPDRVQAASAFDGRLIDIWREYERQCRREGVVDFERCFETLKQSGYCGPYLIEMWSETAEDPAAEVAKARDWVKARMAKAGMVEAA